MKHVNSFVKISYNGERDIWSNRSQKRIKQNFLLLDTYNKITKFEPWSYTHSKTKRYKTGLFPGTPVMDYCFESIKTSIILNALYKQ